MKRSWIAVALLSAALSTTLAGRFGWADVDNVPVERLASNLERQIAEQPQNVELRINLARVHAMAFARKSTTVPVVRPGARAGSTQPTFVPWVDYGVPVHHQVDVRKTDDPQRQAVARDQLSKAIARYREALALAPDNQVAKLGLGWALLQAGERAEAVKTLRDVVAAAWPKDQRGAGFILMGQRSLTEEAARYLIPLLDPERDRAEIEALRRQVRELERQPRYITPIAIPLADGLTALDIADDQAAVAFDADGSALPKRWTWIRPNAAWLVFDRQGSRSITSGLQLFGSVTFWLFWQNGYQALRALDDDGDEIIAGAELQGLALWHDRNANGLSESGEVRPLPDWKIVALSCAYEHDPSHPDEIAFSPRGVTFRDGTTRPTFDLILHPAPSNR